MPNTSRAETPELSNAGAQDDGGRPSDGVNAGGGPRGRDVELEDECVLARAIRQLPCGEIVRRLPRRDRAALAAASSTFMAAVLEGCENTRWTARGKRVGQQVHGKLRRKMPRHATALVGWPVPSTGMVYHRRAGGDALDASCIEHIGPEPGMLASFVSITPDMTGLRRLHIRVERKHLATLAFGERWLPKHVAARIKNLNVGQSDVQSVPPGMIELQKLSVRYCRQLDPDEWLPATSCARLRVLNAGHSRVRRLPEDMMALEELRLDTCVNLPPDSFLPCSSVSRLRTLTLNGCAVTTLPAGMAVLETLDVGWCPNLDVDGWLPESSRGRLRSLNAAFTRLRRVPDEMPALEELRLPGCQALHGEHWLPTSSSCARLRVIEASRSSVTRIPENMRALEQLSVRHCPQLVEDFLPASSAGHIRVLNAANSSLVRLPPGMRALEELCINGCKRLREEGFLPLSSAGRLRALHARRSALQKLPRGLAALEELDVRECELLDDDMDPHVAARLKAWDVSGSDLRLPGKSSRSRGKIQMLI